MMKYACVYICVKERLRVVGLQVYNSHFGDTGRFQSREMCTWFASAVFLEPGFDDFSHPQLPSPAARNHNRLT